MIRFNRISEVIEIKKLFTIVCLTLCLMLVGCSNVITEGEVYNKEHRESRVVVMPMTMVHSNGETTYTTVVPVTWYYPESYVIFIKAYDSENEEWLTEDYYVEEDVSNSTNIGDYFVFDEETMLQDEPREKQNE